MSGTADDEQSVADSLSTVLSGGALVSAGKILALVFGFLVQITMARLLTGAAYGTVVLSISIINIASLAAKLGLDDGVMREYPHHEDDPARARGVVRATVVIAVVSGLVAAGLTFLLAPFIATRIFDNPALSELLRIAAIGIPFITLSSVSQSVARGARNARVHAYVGQLFQPTVRFIVIFVLLVAGFSATGAIAGWAGSLVLSGLLALFLMYRMLPDFEVSAVPMYRSVLAFSIPLIAVQGLGFLNTNIDIYMVGYFMESSVLGVYNIALQLSNLVTAVLATAGFLLPPMLTRLHEQDKREEMIRTYQVLTKWMVVLIMPIFILFFFASELVIGTLFGQNYTDGALALRILLLGKLLAIVMGLNSQSLIALGKNRVVSYIVFCQAAANAALNITLIPIIGFEGAAIGMAVSAVIGDVLGVAILYRHFGLHPFTDAVLKPIGAVLSVSTVGYGVLTVVGLPTAGVVVIVGILYLPIVAIFALEHEDEQLLLRVEDQTGYDLNLVRRAVWTLR